MAFVVEAERQRRPPRPAWMRPRTTESSAVLMLIILVLLGAALTTMVLVAQAVTPPRPPLDEPGSSSDSSAATPVTSPPAASEQAPAAGMATPAPVLAVGSHARIAQTEGLGVVLHTAPRPDARQPAGLLEGTAVTVLELAGGDWARVQSDTRVTGWVPVTFLAPSE